MEALCGCRAPFPGIGRLKCFILGNPIYQIKQPENPAQWERNGTAMENTRNKKRTYMLIFGAFAVFFTGYPHIWSIYQPYIMEQTGWSSGQTSMCFYLALLFFVLGNILGGRLLDRFSPRQIIFIGGGVSSAGILLSAFMMFPSPIPMYATYGIMQGFGQGMVYASVISTALKWFPGRTGYASGIVVTANGICGFFLTPLSKILLEGGGAEQAFFVIGGISAVSWILASLHVGNPSEAEVKVSTPSEKEKAAQDYTSEEMMCTKRFYLLLLTMMFGLMSYFFLSPISQTIQMDRGIPSAAAAGTVMMGSVVNAGVRLALPMLADKVGRVACVEGILTLCAAAMLTLLFSHSSLTMAAIVIMYGCYGGIMGSFPSLTGAIFGLRHVGENYGYVMVGMVMAALGAPAVTSYVLGAGGTQEAVFLIGAVSAGAALGCVIMLSRELKRYLHTAF